MWLNDVVITFLDQVFWPLMKIEIRLSTVVQILGGCNPSLHIFGVWICPVSRSETHMLPLDWSGGIAIEESKSLPPRKTRLKENLGLVNHHEPQIELVTVILNGLNVN